MSRLHDIEAVQERIATEINDALLGTTQEVLVESLPADRRGLKEAVLSGRTRTNKLVHWPGPLGQAESRLGEMIHVRITRAGPWALRGLPAGRHGVQAEAAVPA